MKTTAGRKLPAFTVYNILSLCSSLFFAVSFTLDMVYQVTVAKLDPLQLVLVGTTLEATIFLCEIPTGIVADLKSRRLSIIIGYALIGAGFILEGAIPLFWTILLAQVLWGLGYTFTSGATQAWIVDEIGEQRATEAFLRGAQAGQIGSLLGIPLATLLGLRAVQVPVVASGVLMILLALFLLLAMPEEGFRPTAADKRITWTAMFKTVRDAGQVVRRQPLLLTLLAIELFYGLYSEGFDRLWTAHLLEYTFPVQPALSTAVWFGLIEMVSALLSLGATELTRRRLDAENDRAVGRLLLLNGGLIALTLAGFGLAPSLWPALLLYWLINAGRQVNGPLYEGWYNRQIDNPQVRATMFSVTSQVNAVGQISGGPAVGAIGRARSIRAALLTSAALLVPVVPLYGVALRRGKRREGVPPDPV